MEMNPCKPVYVGVYATPPCLPPTGARVTLVAQSDNRQLACGPAADPGPLPTGQEAFPGAQGLPAASRLTG